MHIQSTISKMLTVPQSPSGMTLRQSTPKTLLPRPTDVAFIQSEDGTRLCNCRTWMKAAFYCQLEPKCNGQTYYCVNCTDYHLTHQQIQINKMVREFSLQYEEFFAEVFRVTERAEKRYYTHRELIEYCARMQSETPNQPASEWNITADFNKLVRFSYKTAKFKQRIDKHIKRNDVVELQVIIPNLMEYRARLKKLNYLVNLTENDIQRCYQSVFLQDVFYKFNDFSEQSFKSIANLKLAAINNFMQKYSGYGGLSLPPLQDVPQAYPTSEPKNEVELISESVQVTPRRTQEDMDRSRERREREE
jgi:hypothetical protein